MNDHRASGTDPPAQAAAAARSSAVAGSLSPLRRMLRATCWVLAILTCLSALGLLVLDLGTLQIVHQSEFAAVVNQPGLITLLRSHATVWLPLTAMALLLATAPGTPGHGGIKANHTRLLILLVAAAVRLTVACTSSPELGSDLWPTLQAGATFADEAVHAATAVSNDGSDPPPAASVAAPAARVPQPTLLLFSVVLWLVRPAQFDPLGDLTFRLVLVAIDLVIVLLLMLRLRRENRSPWWATLYAWHPLVITQVAHAGQPALLGIALLLMALHTLDRRHLNHSKAAVGGVLFGLSAGANPVLLPLGLALLHQHRRDLRLLFHLLAGIVLTLIVLYVGVAALVGSPGALIPSVSQMLGRPAFNAAIYPLLLQVTGRPLAAWFIVGLILASLIVICLRVRFDLWRTCSLYLLAYALLASSIPPWLLLGPLALIPLRFNLAGWLWSLTIVVSYLALADPVLLQFPSRLLAVEYLAVLLGAIWSLGRWFSPWGLAVRVRSHS